jgi:TonB family protein
MVWTSNLLASQSLWRINQITDELTNKKNVFASTNFTTKRGEKLNLSYACEVNNTRLTGLFELTTDNGMMAVVLGSDGAVYSPARVRYGKNEAIPAKFFISQYLTNQFHRSFDFELNESNATASTAGLSSSLRKRFIENLGLEFLLNTGEKIVFKNNGELASYFDNHCSRMITPNLIKAKLDQDLAEKQRKIEEQNIINNQNQKRQHFQSDEYLQLISKGQENNPYTFKDFDQLIENNVLRDKPIDQNRKSDILNAYNRLVLTVGYECITNNGELRYPRIALERGIEGTPRIKTNLDENGNFVSIELASTSGNRALDEAAISAFSKCNIANKLTLMNTNISSVIVGLSFHLQK